MKLAQKLIGAAGALLTGFVTLQAQGGAPLRPTPPRNSVAMPSLSLGYIAKPCLSDDYMYVIKLEQTITITSSATEASATKVIEQTKQYATEFEKRAQSAIGKLTKAEVQAQGPKFIEADGR